MVREVLRAIAVGREIRSDPAYVLVERVADGQGATVGPIAVELRPVRALFALDLGACSQREGTNRCGIHHAQGTASAPRRHLGAERRRRGRLRPAEVAICQYLVCDVWPPPALGEATARPRCRHRAYSVCSSTALGDGTARPRCPHRPLPSPHRPRSVMPPSWLGDATARARCGHRPRSVCPPTVLGVSTDRPRCGHRPPSVCPPTALGVVTARPRCGHRPPSVWPPTALGVATDRYPDPIDRPRCGHRPRSVCPPTASLTPSTRSM